MRTQEPRGTAMSEYGRLAELQIRERIEQNSRSRLLTGRPDSGRHRLARQLHAWADRLDG